MKIFIMIVLIYTSIEMLFPKSETKVIIHECPTCTLSHIETVDIDTTLKRGSE